MKSEIKKRLTMLMYELDMKDNDLFWETGYHKVDVKTKEDFNEIVRLLSTFYFVEKYYID